MKPLEAAARAICKTRYGGNEEFWEDDLDVARAALNAAAENVGDEEVIAARREISLGVISICGIEDGIKAALKKMAEG